MAFRPQAVLFLSIAFFFSMDSRLTLSIAYTTDYQNALCGFYICLVITNAIFVYLLGKETFIPESVTVSDS